MNTKNQFVTKNFLAVLFCVCLIASNLFETKIFQAGPLVLTGGFLIFPLMYILNDCITEVYGYREMRSLIRTAFIMNAFFVLMAQLVILLPSVAFSDSQEHFEYIFKADLRITVASMLAFVLGSVVNSKVMARMKKDDTLKGFGWRAVASSFLGESVDSVIFFPIAFWGVGTKNLLVMMATQIILKTVYEIILLPFTRKYVAYLKRY